MSVTRPHPSRLDPARPDYAAILAAHERAVTRGEATYRDPTTGLAVMTVTSLLERGACCDTGCRHCPYLV